METLFTGYKKITANGLVRRGRPEGVPLVRFDHILFKHNGRLLRATSHEPRATNHEPRTTSHGHCHKPRVTRGDVFDLSLLPRNGI